MSESNIQQNISKASDEIDIFEFSLRLWKAFVSFLSGLKNLFVNIIIFLIRKSFWIAAFTIAGVIMGYVFYGVSVPSYSSLFEGNTGRIDNTIVIDHINKLNLVTGKPILLANYLDISVEQAQMIHYIRAYYGIDINRDDKPDFVDYNETYNPRDTMQARVPSHIYIKVSVYDENILPILRRGIFHYVNSNAYLQELFQIDKRQRQDLLTGIDREISKIDSLQRSRFRRETSAGRGGEINFSLSNEQRIELYYWDILSLYGQKHGIERSLEISDEIITVVHDFTPLEYEENPVRRYVVRNGAIMAVLSIFCSLIWQYRKRIWRLILEDSTNNNS